MYNLLCLVTFKAVESDVKPYYFVPSSLIKSKELDISTDLDQDFFKATEVSLNPLIPFKRSLLVLRPISVSLYSPVNLPRD